MNIFVLCNNFSHDPLIKEPLDWYSVPDSAQMRNGRPFFVPDFAIPCRLELHLALRVSRLGKSISPRFAHRYYDCITIAAHFIAEEKLSNARIQGLPWTSAVGFDGAVSLGYFREVDEDSIRNSEFYITIDGKVRLKSKIEYMRYEFSEVLAKLSRVNTLRNGDLILLGSACSPVIIEPEHRVEGFLNNERLLSFNIK